MQPLDQYRRIAQCDGLIRPMGPQDLEQVLLIEQSSYSHPWTVGVFRDCDRAPYERWLLECESGPGGYAIILPQVDELHLLNLCVSPALRGRGIGRRLLRYVIVRARALGCERVLLEVRESNEPAFRLYESEGFVEVGRRKGYYPGAGGREDARVMALENCCPPEA